MGWALSSASMPLECACSQVSCTIPITLGECLAFANAILHVYFYPAIFKYYSCGCLPHCMIERTASCAGLLGGSQMVANMGFCKHRASKVGMRLASMSQHEQSLAAECLTPYM